MNGVGYAIRYFVTDLVPVLAFTLIVLLTGDVFLATAIGLVIGVVQIGTALWLKKPIGTMQWASVGLIAVLGTTTLLTHDARFVMVKPTATRILLGLVMLRAGWMERYVPPIVREAARPMLRIFGFIWAGLMFTSAGLNLLFVAFADPQSWAAFNLIFPPVSMTTLFAVQTFIMRRSLMRRPPTVAAAVT